MRDDDEEEDLGTPGKIYHAGFQPGAGPADYALAEGTPALQGEESELVTEPETGNVSRRTMMLACVGVGLTGATATWLGTIGGETDSSDTGVAAAPPSTRSPRSQKAEWLVQGAKKAARGKLDDLVAAYGTYMMVVERYEQSDPILWEGVERLGQYSLVERSQKGFDIATRILGTFELVPVPSRYTSLRFELEDFVRRWRKR